VIEALIGYMKVEGLIDRNWLKGTSGDAILCVAGQNLRLHTKALLVWLRSLCGGPFLNQLFGQSPERLRHTTRNGLPHKMVFFRTEHL
jgi:hypothetical protein